MLLLTCMPALQCKASTYCCKHHENSRCVWAILVTDVKCQAPLNLLQTCLCRLWW